MHQGTFRRRRADFAEIPSRPHAHHRATEQKVLMDEDHEPQGEWVRKTAGAFLTVENVTYIALGALLSATALMALAGAAWVLLQGLADWSNTGTVFLVIDRLLFVLMLVEILHTVRASMRSGELTAEPFLVVGLIATIRRVLIITLKSSETTKQETMTDMTQRVFQASMLELVVLAVLIIVMVVSIRILRRPRRTNPATPRNPETSQP
jgi:uncharacterized membrane protein (DUF373 family)